MTDNEILTLYREGDPQGAFSLIVSLYSERLYWYVRGMGLSHEDTDDLLQEIFVKVWGSLPSFRGESKLFTWLYRIATNEVLNFKRYNSVRSSIRSSLTPIGDEAEGKVDEDPYFDGDEAQRVLLRAISTLPERQRAVFTMRYYDELKYEDIAEILDVSVGSLKASYHIAYGKVKKYLEENL